LFYKNVKKIPGWEIIANCRRYFMQFLLFFNHKTQIKWSDWVPYEGLSYVFTMFRNTRYKSPPSLSPICDQWINSLDVPIVLTYGHTVPSADTFRNDILNYRFPPFDPFNDQTFSAATELLNHMCRKIPLCDILDIEQAVSAVKKTSVCGLPFPFSKKKTFFDHPSSRSFLSAVYEMVEMGFSDFTWQVSQKYELRPLEKLAEGKVRTFLCAPVDLVVFNTMFGQNYNEHFYTSRTYTPSCVGMSKYYRGYHNIALDLLRNGKKRIYWFDYSKFDKRITSFIMFVIYNLRRSKIKFITHAQIQVYYALVIAVIFSNIVFENGDVYRKFGANPSGNTNTICDNTQINIFLFAWFLLQYYPLEEILDIMKLISLKSFGDDGIYSPPQEYESIINNSNFFSFLESRGFAAEGNLEAGDISQAEFLSHSFYHHEGFYYPFLGTAKMLASLVLGGNSGLYDNCAYRLLRCYALRVEVWPNVELRNYCDSFACFIKQSHHASLYSNLIIGETSITPENIASLDFSDYEIECLYKGLESNCDFSFYMKLRAVVDVNEIPL
jgi:hypothetical protein